MNWDKKTLGEIYEIEGGSVQTGPFGSQLHESDYTESGVPVIMPKDIKNDKLDLSSISFISDDDAKRLSQHIVRKNDIVCPRRGEIGKRIIIEDENVGAFCGTGCIRLRGSGTILDQLFFFYFLKQAMVVIWIENQAIGATMMNLNTSILKSIPIKYPSLPIQQKIASILSAYDELIENNKQRIKLLEGMAEEIYKEWFVRLRFPDYENTKIVDGLPECWEKVKIDDYIKFEKGIEPGSDNYSSEKIDDNYLPFLRFGDLGSRDNSIFVHKDFLKGKILSKEDIAITLDGSVGLVAMNLSGGYSSGVRKIVYKKIKIKRSFIYLTLLSENIQGTIKAHAAGTTILHAGSSINFMRILLPDEIILVKFEEIVNPMIEEILLLKEKIQHLKETRDLLLPRLISGKLSVEHLIDENDDLLMVAEPSGEYK